MSSKTPGLPSWSNKLIDRLAYARDASMYRLLPEALIRPSNETEIINLLSYARQAAVPVTFRGAGTSLSGQSITTGIVAETIRDWTDHEILQNGKYIRLEPGVIGARANLYLKPYSRRIGPDPASLNVARIGGIVANNSSGMICGIKNNSYHTLKFVRFILANGNLFDTSIKSDYQRFLQEEKKLSQGLENIKKEIESKPELIKKIRDKYRIKNTIGYSMNAILDYDHALDIFSHLLVGSEGTLAFTSSVTLRTIFDPPFNSTGLAIFENVSAATKILPYLIESGADAVELMDSSALKTAQFLTHAPYDYRMIKPQSAALLFEYQQKDENNLNYLEKQAIAEIIGQKGKIINAMQRSPEKRALLWNIRKGLYPTVGAMRKAGSSFITEDLCYDYTDLPEVVNEMHSIFKNWKYDDAVIFGHAKDGNLHFVGSADLNQAGGVKNLDGMLNDLVDMTLGKFQGSLKAEHGTGRNMAPFVEREWGSELYNIMWTIKSLADPDNILNPGVMLNRDKSLHLKSIKRLPLIDENVDLCVECGFCEAVCPSNLLTLTPRQRITVARELSMLENKTEYKQVKNDYLYMGTETCAVDGLCELTCPVNINTGNFVKIQRLNNHSAWSKWMADRAADNFKLVQTISRGLLNFIQGIIFFTGQNFILFISSAFSKILPGNFPQWNSNLPKSASKIPRGSSHKKPDYIYYPTCLTRILSPDKKKNNLADIILEISLISKDELFIPEKIDGCCGTPFSSKGFKHADQIITSRTIDQLYEYSGKGSIPILIDTSPCTYKFINAEQILQGESLEKWKTLTFIDITQYLKNCVEKSDLKPLKFPVILHPTCSAIKMELNADLIKIGEKCSVEPIIPVQSGCCGFAGDRGLKLPELTASATKLEAAEVNHLDSKILGYSSSRTCEIGMQSSTENNYFSLAVLVRSYLLQSD